MKRAYAQATKELECSKCGDLVYTCWFCKEYFEEEGEEIYCDEVSKHFCSKCYKKLEGDEK